MSDREIDGTVFGDALISECQRYRYWLHRHCNDKGKGTCVFIMLNPSTADACVDDRTICRCKGYATSWGFKNLFVVNLYALRATDPKELWESDDPTGPDNDAHLCDIAMSYDKVVCAWGDKAQKKRQDQVLKLLSENDVKLRCLGVTQKGFPRHPLYLKKDLKPVAFNVNSP